MNWSKFFRRGLTACLAVIFALGAVFVGAAIKTFNGTGKYIMSDFENQEIAQQRAIQRAKEDAQDQAGVYLTSFSQKGNSNLVADEISAVTNNILEVFDVKVEPKPFEVEGESGIIWIATLSANIDPDGIFEYMKRDDKEKNTIIKQNNNLQDAIQKNDKQVEDLKEQYKRATSEAEKKRIREQMKQADRDFLANQKLEEGNKLAYALNFEEAIKFYNETLELKPNWDLAYNNRGNAYRGIGSNERAIQDYDKAIELNPNYAEAYNNRGFIYYLLKQYERAIQDFNKAIQLNPNFDLAYEDRGDAYFTLGQNERALQDYTRAIEINPIYTGYYLFRGEIYLRLKNYDAAERDFKKVIELDPDSEKYAGYCLIASSYEEIDDNHEEAIKYYSKALELNPNYAWGYNDRGDAYYKLKQYESAIQDYTKVIELDPSFALAYYNRGNSYYNLEQYERAIQDYTNAVEINPNYADAYYNRGIAYRNLEQYAQAIQDFSQAIELDMNYDYVYVNRGLSYAYIGQYERAIQDCDKSIELNPNYAMAYQLRGACYQALGDNEKAQADFSKAKQLGYNG